jgi:hypothetical protein
MADHKDTPLCPPEESMWQKYSPHFELPLAGFTSFFLHGLLLGVMIMIGIGLLFATDVEATKPPSMDVVMLAAGSGFEGGGGEPGLPGAPDAGGTKRTEQVTPLPQFDKTEYKQPPRLLKDAPPELGLPLIDDGIAPVNSELSIQLERLAKEAADQARKELKAIEKQPVGPPGDLKKPGKIGTGNPKGTGGPGGGGTATQQQIFAWRWHFELGGDPKEHIRKLIAMGVHVAVVSPQGQAYFITDLKRRPAEMTKGTVPDPKEVVSWENRSQPSIVGFAREMKLPFMPKRVVLLLPKEREQKMAQEEARFAGEQGRDVRTVTKTYFDFRLRNGAYEPLGIRLE